MENNQMTSNEIAKDLELEIRVQFFNKTNALDKDIKLDLLWNFFSKDAIGWVFEDGLVKLWFQPEMNKVKKNSVK